MLKMVPLLLLLFFVQSHAQQDDAEETVYATSCSLSVKTTVYPVEDGDVVAKVSIQATLSDKSGIPIPNQKITMTSTSGTFTCIAPDGAGGSNTADHSCFITGPDGKILVFLVDVPFNKPGQIKAVCTYGNFTLHASSRYSIKRKVTRIKSDQPVTPRSDDSGR